MKKILGLDLGTTSIGWALVNEAESENEKSSIIRLGVRVNPLTTDEQQDFEKGKSITTNAARTMKRSVRRNLQRYKLRRKNLIEVLLNKGFIDESTPLYEKGNSTTFKTYEKRAAAVTEEISLEDFARVLLMINKKRGYKSSRKAKSAEEGELIDGMSVAKKLYNENITPGQLVFSLLNEGKKFIPAFYVSDLRNEFSRVWNSQKEFYPDILTDELYSELESRKKKDIYDYFIKEYKVYAAECKGKDKRYTAYRWRSEALHKQLDLSEVVYVLGEIASMIAGTSGYLGEIGDRSKDLFFTKRTVGQYLMDELKNNPNASLKKRVFYRQDYLDEFERIWEKQAEYHKELTPELKADIRDMIIFYQRRLKSQKGLVSTCELLSHEINLIVDGKNKKKKVGPKVCPKSSPLFQEFRIRQILNDVRVIDRASNVTRPLSREENCRLFEELQFKSSMKKSEVLKLLFRNYRELDLNFEQLEGNRTQTRLYEAFEDVIAMSGNGEFDFSKMSAAEIKETVSNIFTGLGFNTSCLYFDSTITDDSIYEQSMFKLWHLLYSYEGDNSKTGIEGLKKKISKLLNCDEVSSSIIAHTTFEQDYCSLSSKALRMLLPLMRDGLKYSDACSQLGLNHSSRSLTAEELNAKNYVEHLDLLPRNSLRNPVVEKILNQMINVVNQIVDTYGKPDEIRIELARNLKQNAKQRAESIQNIAKATAENNKNIEILKKDFSIAYPTKTDIIRYKLYLELKDNGFKTLYSNTYIPKDSLFNGSWDIEHIIPRGLLYDDSYSNKTLELRSVNENKGKMTAFDYMKNVGGAEKLAHYKAVVEDLYKRGSISEKKRENLLITEKQLKDGFIARDLNDTRYISRKAKEILESLVRDVVATSGEVTARLRNDWQLVDVMKELNMDKYDRLGMVKSYTGSSGNAKKCIVDWTKRNDHRHHAVDALTTAFSRREIVQHINTLHASDEPVNIYSKFYKGQKYLSPIPVDDFRSQAKWHLENILVSIKAKNKVVTKNVNKTKRKNGVLKKVQLTPRAQLHNETVYGSRIVYTTKEEKVNASFTPEQIARVCKRGFREALMRRLAENGGDPKKAFTGKMSLDKTPLYVDNAQMVQVPVKVKVVYPEIQYTIRKAVSPDLKVEKVVDKKLRELLEARIQEYGDAKAAFSNLDEHPIWLDKEHTRSLKRVTITGVSNTVALHDKRGVDGSLMFDVGKNKQPVDFVSTSGNHHVAIYRDADGNLQERVVSYFEATSCAVNDLPVVDRAYNCDKGWTFLFTMKQNEYFVFPNEETGFDPNEIDLKDKANYPLISPNLFRVQKLASKNYVFRHHLETNVEENSNLRDIAWKRIQSLPGVEGIVKVRINHIGDIVDVGEY